MVVPVEGEINNANRAPVIRNLPSCTVHYARDLVSNHELEILSFRLNCKYDRERFTEAAYSSPRKRPSLILMAPIIGMSAILYYVFWRLLLLYTGK